MFDFFPKLFAFLFAHSSEAATAVGAVIAGSAVVAHGGAALANVARTYSAGHGQKSAEHAAGVVCSSLSAAAKALDGLSGVAQKALPKAAQPSK